MQKGRQIFVDNTQLAVAGRFFRTVRLGHEGFEFLEDPLAMIKRLQQAGSIADVFTFVEDRRAGDSKYSFRGETGSISVLTIETYDKWWKNLDFKVRNKIRKAHKIGVEV